MFAWEVGTYWVEELSWNLRENPPNQKIELQFVLRVPCSSAKVAGQVHLDENLGSLAVECDEKRRGVRYGKSLGRKIKLNLTLRLVLEVDKHEG